jgi:hypothetical protein
MKKGLYATEPVAKQKRIANRNPVGTPTVGNLTPPTVPQKPAELHGIGPVAHSFPTHHVKGAHGFGHIAKHGSLRLSGDTNAHRIGGSNKPPKNPKLG